MTDLHYEAARIVRKFNSKEGFMKNLVFSSGYKNLRQLFALVSESIKYQSILKDILKRSGISFESEELVGKNEELATVLLYDELIGPGFGRAVDVRRMMRKYKAEIKAARDDYLKENNATSLAAALTGETDKDFPTLPRYARVNLIKCTVQQGIDKLCEEGWEYRGRMQLDRFKEDVASLSENQFGLDPLLEDVLIFPFNTDLHMDKLVVDGILVLQERASCVPAHVLNPVPGSVVLDCCAAPGNKTSHLASLMGDQGHVIALDRDGKRVSTMNFLLQRTGATCVETITQDFLTLSPHSDEVSNITMILLDPSCSCTGMPTGTSYRQEVPIERIKSLKRYQLSLLKHALRFPNVQRVVYSTCSTSRQENEEVVEEVMCNVRHCFSFVPVLPNWPNSRGMKKFLHHQSFLRVSPEEHLSAGFFVACFERIKKKSEKSDCKKENSENGIDKNDGECHDVEGDESKLVHEVGTEFDKEQNSHNRKKKQRKDSTDDSLSKKIDVKKDKRKRKIEDSEDGQIDKDLGKRSKMKEDDDSVESNDTMNYANDYNNEDKNSEDLPKKKKKRSKHALEEANKSSADAKELKNGHKDSAVDDMSQTITKKHVAETDENTRDIDIQNDNGEDVPKKKKKKKRVSREMDEKSTDIMEFQNDNVDINSDVPKKKKKKTKHNKEMDETSTDMEFQNDNVDINSEDVPKKKKKKTKHNKEMDETSTDMEFQNDNVDINSEDVPKKKKKKNKRSKEMDETSIDIMEFQNDLDINSEDVPKRKKKKTKHSVD